MATLGSIGNIGYNITHAKLRVAKILHYICFTTDGEPRKTRKALRAFPGFRLDDTSEQFLSKCQDVSENFDLPDLIAVCQILGLNYKNEKHDVVVRICSFLNTFINDDETEDDEEEDDVSDMDEDDERRKEEKRQLKDEKRQLEDEKRQLEDEKRRLEEERRKDDERREKEKRRLEEERREDDERRSEDERREEKERRRRERRNDEDRRRREGRNYDEGRQICDERRRYERNNDEERRKFEERRDDEDIYIHEEIGQRSYSARNDAEVRSVNTGATGIRRQESFALSFRDVEDSIRSFDGKDEYPIRTWIIEFEEVAEITGWNNLQKLIYAKKCLKGLAKLFVQSEKGIRNWPELKRRLIEEFGEQVNSAQIHKMLMARRKKFDETVQEYMIKMREIANRAYLEQEVVMQYIIDGIQDESSNKLVLYGAKNFAEFKEKIKLYERIRGKKATGQAQVFRANKEGFKKNEDIVRKDKREKNDVKRENNITCFNCGSRGHKSKDCPDKFKGTKCFGCNKYGHVSSKCPNKNSTKATTENTALNVIEVQPKTAVKLTINQITLTALFDTGSDICTIREDVYATFFNDICLTPDTIILKGLGQNAKVNTLGSFSTQADVNEEKFDLTFHIIPKAATSFQAIIGNNILQQASVSIRDDGIVMYKRTDENFIMHIMLDEKDKENEVKVAHIKDEKHREIVRLLMESYEPKKTKTTEIEMEIVLKSEEPIYERPRRLSVSEKEEVDSQINEWLNEGIIKPSCSDFASPIVLVKKKDGRTRICCDYRKVNKNIIRDRFPLPLVEDVLDCLQGANIFSTIDLKNGFFHVPVEFSSTKYTSFVTPSGQFEFLKCPFGLCNSPEVFQRFIAHIFRELTAQKYVIYYLDDFTKFVWLYPTKSTTKKEVISCLEKQRRIFGNRSGMITDRGTAFRSEEFKRYCQQENIQHVLVTTEVPRGNGQVERVNRTMIPVLTKLSLEEPTKWYKNVDRVQNALNSTYQRSIGTTPFEVLVGVKMKNKDDIRIRELIEEEVIKIYDEERKELRERCKEQICKVQAENKKGYNSRRKRAKIYKEKDLVAIKRTQFGPGLKLKIKFLGPYEIVKVKDNDRYDVVKIGEHEGPMRTSTCAEYLKPWVDNESDESESDSEEDGRV
ncbi:uncharacterized protein [Diabrotica undecimpunctata]|uniref:uncharacterized protein n=1 Tax=Diabrotica undecimpunctata TaxID=50387 RepID=UPI003B6365D3